MQKQTAKDIANIVKVNHAGEYGAIRIYRAQIAAARICCPDLVPFLSQTLAHEIEHCRKFKDAMPARNTRPCYTMWFWSWGGYVLGLVTALTGRNGIMVCTEAVEEAVHHHMDDQLAYLQGRDEELRTIIESIKVEELEHLHYAQAHVRHNTLTRLTYKAIYKATDILIWLSTQGASSRMKQRLKTSGCL